VSTDTDKTTINHLFGGEDAGQEAPTQPEQATPEQLVGEEGQQPPPPDVEGHGMQGEDGQTSVPGQEQEQDQPRMVPLPELLEERKQRQEAQKTFKEQQQRLQQLEQMVQGLYQPQNPQQRQPQPDQYAYSQQQEPGIDPVDDPHGYARAIEERVERKLLDQKLTQDEARLRQTYGSEAVDEAYQDAQQAGFLDAFVGRQDAWDRLMEWHKAQKLRSEVGDDFESYRKKLEEEAEQRVLARLKQGQPPPSNLPPSLSTATKANSAPEAVPDGKDFFKEMMNKK